MVWKGKGRKWLKDRFRVGTNDNTAQGVTNWTVADITKGNEDGVQFGDENGRPVWQAMLFGVCPWNEGISCVICVFRSIGVNKRNVTIPRTKLVEFLFDVFWTKLWFWSGGQIKNVSFGHLPRWCSWWRKSSNMWNVVVELCRICFDAWSYCKTGSLFGGT